MSEITAPGVYDLPAAEYHADPVKGGSLSSSGARRLLPPSCPAVFRYQRDHPPASTPEFDLGHAAHKLVLGAGPDIVAIDAEDWRSKGARDARALAYEAGRVPLLAADVDRVYAMAAALRNDPIARALLDPDRGRAEQTLVWQDDETGVMCRAMLDWLPHAPRPGRRRLIADYKTTVSAYPPAFAKSASTYGYHQQAAFYLDGVRALLDDNPAFVFIAQEKTPPYLVSVVELEPDDIDLGARLNRRAREIFRDCTASDIWPGYGNDIAHIALPTWARRQQEELTYEY